MDRYQETFETWNKLAQLYQDKFMYLDLYHDTYDVICHSLAKKNATLLEVGCGPGNITQYLLSKRPDFAILGIDIAPNMIELAQRNNPSAHFKVMDGRHINTIQSTFDAIVCGFCLPYLAPADSMKFITDCYQILNENGLLYLSFVEGNPKESDYQTSSTGDRSFFYFYEANDLKSQLLAHNFGEITLFKVNYKRSETITEVHTIIVAKKVQP